MAGLEPTTSGVTSRRSSTELRHHESPVDLDRTTSWLAAGALLIEFGDADVSQAGVEPAKHEATRLQRAALANGHADSIEKDGTFPI